MDRLVYMSVHSKAKSLWGIIDLFVVWQKGDTTYKLPILSEEELLFALQQEGKVVCIELGPADELYSLVSPSVINWDKVDSITKDGFLYVKYNDVFN